MIEQLKLEEASVIELHPKGGSRIRPLRDVLSDNYGLYAAGKTPQWISVAVRSDTVTAQKELSAIRRRMREAKKIKDAPEGK